MRFSVDTVSVAKFNINTKYLINAFFPPLKVQCGLFEQEFLENRDDARKSNFAPERRYKYSSSSCGIRSNLTFFLYFSHTVAVCADLITGRTYVSGGPLLRNVYKLYYVKMNYNSSVTGTSGISVNGKGFVT